VVLRDLIGTGVGTHAAAEAVVDGLTALEAGLHGVPVLDRGFARLPAEQDDVILDAAGEVEQAGPGPIRGRAGCEIPVRRAGRRLWPH
jgi:hypothetical protein